MRRSWCWCTGGVPLQVWSSFRAHDVRLDMICKVFRYAATQSTADQRPEDGVHFNPTLFPPACKHLRWRCTSSFATQDLDHSLLPGCAAWVSCLLMTGRPGPGWQANFPDVSIQGFLYGVRWLVQTSSSMGEVPGCSRHLILLVV